MAKQTYSISVTLSDGRVVSCKSTRNYTHAVIWYTDGQPGSWQPGSVPKVWGFSGSLKSASSNAAKCRRMRPGCLVEIVEIVAGK